MYRKHTMAYSVLKSHLNRDLAKEIVSFMGPSERECEKWRDLREISIFYFNIEGFMFDSTFSDYFIGTPGFVKCTELIQDFNFAIRMLAADEIHTRNGGYFSEYRNSNEISSIFIEIEKMAKILHDGERYYEMYDKLLEYTQYNLYHEVEKSNLRLFDMDLFRGLKMFFRVKK